MHIKKQTVIPATVKITRVAAGTANATPLRVLRAREESRLSGNAPQDADQTSEARMERFHMARGAGLCMSDALDEMNDYGHDDRDSPRYRD